MPVQSEIVLSPVQAVLVTKRVSEQPASLGGGRQPEAHASSARRTRDEFKVRAITAEEEIRPDVEERRWEGRREAKDILVEAGFTLRVCTSSEHEEWVHENGSLATVERSGRWSLTPSVGARVGGYDPALLLSTLRPGK